MSRVSLAILLAVVLSPAGCNKMPEPAVREQVPAPAQMSAPPPPSTTAAVPENAPVDATGLERQAAEWALARGGKVVLDTGATVKDLAELPAGPFSLVEVSVWTEGSKPVEAGDIEKLRALPKLQRLIFRGNPVPDAALAALRGMATLQTLNLHATSAADSGLEHLGNLPALTHLDLGYNSQITDAGAAHLRNLTRLKSLNIYNTKISDAGLKNLEGMKSLEYLELHGTLVTPAGLVELESLSALKRLVVPKSFSDADLAPFQTKLPACTIEKR